MVEFVNGSFDANLPPSGHVVINSQALANQWIPGWRLVSGSVDIMSFSAVDLHGEEPGTISQTLNTTGEEGKFVRFEITVRDNPTPGLISGFQMRINGQPRLPEDTSAAASFNPSSGEVILHDGGGWLTFTYTFEATGSDTVQITGTGSSGWPGQYRGTYLRGMEVVAVVCLVRGTRVATDRGAVAVEHLAEGMRVRTADHGFQPLRWVGSRTVPACALRVDPKLRPVRIAAGALGPGLPARDLRVSRQHRILLASPIVARVCGVPEVLAPAIRLAGLPGIAVEEGGAQPSDGVEYFHLAFDRHEVILAEGAPTESLLLGPQARKWLGARTTELIARKIGAGPETPAPARPLPDGRTLRQLVALHRENTRLPLTRWHTALASAG